MANTQHIGQDNFKQILRRNILLPLGISFLSAIVFVALVLYLLSSLQWVEHTERAISNFHQVAKLSVDMESGMRGFAITKDESFLRPYELSRSEIAARMATLKELVADNPVQIERLTRIDTLQSRWKKYAQEVINLRRVNGDYEAVVRRGDGKAAFDQIRSEFADAVDMEERLLWERTATAKQTTFWIVGIYLVLTISLGAGLALFGRRELINLSGSYEASLQKQIEHAGLLQEQSWVKSGQAGLNDALAGQLALSSIADNALQFVAEYLDAAVAAFYAREENGRLARVASFGFTRDALQATQSFGPNEGLIGQATREKRLLFIRDVPDDYLKVTSGLGDGKPRNIAILPFANEGKVNGVLEMGFMRPLEQRDIDFLTLIADNLGTSVNAALYRERLQIALEETQQLNEELQVQQEELRTANEELEEQSRVLEESQVNLENQKAELEQTNEQLAEQAAALDQKNAALNAAQIEIENRSEELQRASQYKSEFLANMSHELRTPLNSSLILAKMLSNNPQGNLTEEQVKFAQTIYSAGNDLLVLINDILDISKVEAGKMQLNQDEISLAKLANSLKATFEPMAKEKKLAFSIDLGNAAPAAIISDRLRVEQILKNLLSNAIKFTDAGTVSLAIGREPDGRVRFAVQDSGIGIAPGQQEMIFEAFRQADGAINRRYGGTGLGLSISRDLATLLGGEIRVSSVEGQGSTFTLLMPQRRTGDATAPASASPAVNVAPVHVPAAPVSIPVPASSRLPAFPDDRHEPPRGRTLLVIEDDPEFARILFDLAHEMQFRCLVTHAAEEGLSLAAEFLPDAILLDMRLPDRSGLAVLQRLKINPATRHIPVHIVSAVDRADAALHLGAIGYAVKPTTREELKEVFQKLENKFTQKMKRVLLVEDDARQRESVAQLIGGEDVEITAVELGEQALEELRTSVFDCMIIDLKLPDIQGNELLQRMASEDIYSFPPVIVYTGRNLSREEEAELMKYSRSIIIKGARSPERLLDEVTLFLHKVESQLSTEAQSMLKTVRNRDRVFEGRKILLVDDDVRNIFALTSALEQKGATVEIGRNGQEAIDKLDKASDIDLVLMDIMMPVMDGLEATRHIRRDARFQKLPIIAITAKATKDDQQQCINAGATDYLSKPIDLDRLLSLLRVWMPHMERYAE